MTTCFFNNGKLYADTRVSNCSGAKTSTTFKIRSLCDPLQDDELGDMMYFAGAGSLKIIDNVLGVKNKLLKNNPNLTFRDFTNALHAGLYLTENHSKFIFVGVKDGEVKCAALTKERGLVVHKEGVVVIGSGSNHLSKLHTLHADDPMRMMRIATICDRHTNNHWTILDPLKQTMKNITVKPTKNIIDAINKRNTIPYDVDLS